MNIDIDKIHKLPAHQYMSVADMIQEFFHATYRQTHSHMARIKMAKDFIKQLEEKDGK